MSYLKQSLDVSSLVGLHSICARATVNAAPTSILPVRECSSSSQVWLNTSQMTPDIQKLDAEEIFY